MARLKEDNPENWQTEFAPTWIPILAEAGNFYLTMGSADIQTQATGEPVNFANRSTALIP